MQGSAKHQRLWRIFCAVELPEQVRTRVAEHISRLRETAPAYGVRWERAEKLHITLKFLGEIEEERAAQVVSAAERAAKKAQPFEIAVEEAGAFPPRGAPRVLWLGLTDAAKQLALLQRRLEDELACEMFAREARSFHPHLTIARLQRTPAAEARTLIEAHKELEFKATGFAVTELVVMRSELSSSGSRYTALARHGLGARKTEARG